MFDPDVKLRGPNWVWWTGTTCKALVARKVCTKDAFRHLMKTIWRPAIGHAVNAMKYEEAPEFLALKELAKQWKRKES